MKKLIAKALGLIDAYKRIIVLEVTTDRLDKKVQKLEIIIDGLKMENDILYAKSLKR
jgi:predicted ATP-grasp superfamily ATP-dependent carboligase